MSDSEDDIPVLIEHKEIKTEDVEDKHVPLTIICGFLGAGKSTLLKRILTERHGYRIAVIMNEFGDTADIESKAINVSSEDDPGSTSEEFLELANGCLCCSIKDTGVAAIEKLMLKKGAFDHILLETTGLADPGPIAGMFWHNEEFASGLGRDIALDGVICVVDAVFGKQQMEEDHAADGIGESLRQIAGSDVILLNKADLVAPDQLASTESLIQKINLASPIHRTIQGQIDLKHLLGIAAYSRPPPLSTSSSDTPHVHTSDCKHGGDDHGAGGSTHYEIRGISSLQVSCSPLSQSQLDALDEWLRSVLWENRIPENSSPAASSQDSNPSLQVLRCKGTFVVNGVHYILQGVRSMYDISKLYPSQTMGVPDVGKVVLIGKGLDDSVRKSLQNVLSS